MKLWKKSERTRIVSKLLAGFRTAGMTTQNIGRWMKWKELRDGERLSVHIDVYELRWNGQLQGYIISDTLGRQACEMVSDKSEVLNWFAEHGYKPEKQWYLEDGGMDEETWEAWNNAE